MKNMKTHKLFILFVVSSLLIIGGGVLYFLLNNINSQNQITVNTEQLKEESYIDFYNLYYALETNEYTKSLSQSNIDDIKNRIVKYKVDNLIDKSFSVYDIWLYLSVIDKLNIDLDSSKKKVLLDYISKLYNKSGFYKSYPEEENNLEDQNYLLSTKMTIESLEFLEDTIPNNSREQILKWLDLNFPSNLSKNDVLSYADLYYVYLELSNSLENKSKTININDLKYINKELNNEENSLIKHIVLANISKVSSSYDKNTNKNSAKEVLERLEKNKDGGYPLFGDDNQDSSDILSTYQVYYLFDFYGLEKNADEKSHHYIHQRINNSFSSTVINGH